MAQVGPVVLIMGSGPNALQARGFPRDWFDRIVVMNNAWQVRPDWDALVYPEDFANDRMPVGLAPHQRLVDASEFVPAQNAYGGFVHAGATMAYTTAYWALHAFAPRVMAFIGCDMTYPADGNTHFYGTGTADPLRDDVTLRDLGAKSARLAMIAFAQGCHCVKLSGDPSALLFDRAQAVDLRGLPIPDLDCAGVRTLRAREAALGYATPDGRYDPTGRGLNIIALDEIDAQWRALFQAR